LSKWSKPTRPGSRRILPASIPGNIRSKSGPRKNRCRESLRRSAADLRPGRRGGRRASVSVETSGGHETNPMWTSQISNESFQTALREALTLSRVFLSVVPGTNDQYHLQVSLLDLKEPFGGFDMTVRATCDWVLERGNGNVVWQGRQSQLPSRRQWETAPTALLGDESRMRVRHTKTFAPGSNAFQVCICNAEKDERFTAMVLPSATRLSWAPFLEFTNKMRGNGIAKLSEYPELRCGWFGILFYYRRVTE
jgi:hypothetical protein